MENFWDRDRHAIKNTTASLKNHCRYSSRIVCTGFTMRDTQITAENTQGVGCCLALICFRAINIVEHGREAPYRFSNPAKVKNMVCSFLSSNDRQRNNSGFTCCGKQGKFGYGHCHWACAGKSGWCYADHGRSHIPHMAGSMWIRRVWSQSYQCA